MGNTGILLQSKFCTFSTFLSQPENLLIYRKGSLEIKIVDFGLAVQLQEGQEMKSLVGTAEYVCKFVTTLFCCCISQ